jgi:hypothetical protein
MVKRYAEKPRERTKRKPEAFYGKLYTRREKGMVLVVDERIRYSGRWFPYYAYPTPLAKSVANDYPLGSEILTIRVTEWKNGRVLTTISKKSDVPGLSFEIWAGLTKLKKG